jgi:hypothetical protein
MRIHAPFYCKVHRGGLDTFGLCRTLDVYGLQGTRYGWLRMRLLQILGFDRVRGAYDISKFYAVGK